MKPAAATMPRGMTRTMHSSRLTVEDWGGDHHWMHVVHSFVASAWAPHCAALSCVTERHQDSMLENDLHALAFRPRAGRCNAGRASACRMQEWRKVERRSEAMCGTHKLTHAHVSADICLTLRLAPGCRPSVYTREGKSSSFPRIL